MIGCGSGEPGQEGLPPRLGRSVDWVNRSCLHYLKNREKGGMTSSFLPFLVNQNLGDPTLVEREIRKIGG
jgi:hypothetical protein